MREDKFERHWGWLLQGRRPNRFGLVLWWFFATFVIFLGVAALLGSMFALPEDYSPLDQRGVRVTATFQGCTQGRGAKCQLRLPSSRSEWNYPQNFGQFRGLRLGEAVEVVIDPEDPHTRYTATDVRARFNAGLGPFFGFGVVAILLGLGAIPILLRFSRGMFSQADEREQRA